MNSHELRLLILAALKRCGDHKLPEPALIETVKQLSSEDVSTSDVKIDINYLENKGWIDFTKDPLGGPDKRWFITEEGKRKVAA
jgi:DNA-binding MarR family transcriptional regulator